MVRKPFQCANTECDDNFEGNCSSSKNMNDFNECGDYLIYLDNKTKTLTKNLSLVTQKKNEEIEELKKQKDQAYQERNKLIVLISKIFPSHLAKHPDSDINWEKDWMNIVCIHFPMFQAAWHIHDSEVNLFQHLQLKPNDWDGHTTEQKYENILKMDGKIPHYIVEEDEYDEYNILGIFHSKEKAINFADKEAADRNMVRDKENELWIKKGSNYHSIDIDEIKSEEE